jgi:hypothetical protein
VNGFIDHFYRRLQTTSNYSATAKLHTLQITAANTKSSPALSVFNSRFLATTSNSGDFSASSARVVTVRRISRYSQHSTQLSIALLIISQHATHGKHAASIVIIQLLHIKILLPRNWNVFTDPLPRNALVYPPISRSLHNNGYTRYNIHSTVLVLSLLVCMGLSPSGKRTDVWCLGTGY